MSGQVKKLTDLLSPVPMTFNSAQACYKRMRSPRRNIDQNDDYLDYTTIIIYRSSKNGLCDQILSQNTLETIP